MQDSVIEQAKRSSTFCMYPFTHLATKTDGSLKLCCRSEPIANVNEVGALETWNNQDYKRIRRQLLNGEKPKECEDCWRMEKVGTRSMRQRALNANSPGSRWNRYADSLKHCKPDGTMEMLPRSLELKISNLCNLKCRMCNPLDSTLWVKDWPEVEDMMLEHNTWAYETAIETNVKEKVKLSCFEDNELWWSQFEKLIDNLELVEFAGGEPLIDPIHYRLLDTLSRRAPQIRLKYSTNLTKLNHAGKHIFEYWKNFASVNVYASLDGIDDVYEYIRTGTKFAPVIENLKSIRDSNAVKIEELAVACTIQVYNAFQLPEIFDYFLDLGVHLHTHRVTFPNVLSAQILPAHIKAELTAEIHAYIEKIRGYGLAPRVLKNAEKHLSDHLNFMNGVDASHLIPAFAEFTRRLDRARKTDICEVVPRLAPLMAQPLATKPLPHSNQPTAVL